MGKLKDNKIFSDFGIQVPDVFTGIKGNVLNTPKVLDPKGQGDWDWSAYEKGQLVHVQPL